MIILADLHQELRRYVERLEGEVLDYNRLQGLLCGIACSPEAIAVSEWFELVWLSDEPQFDDTEQAEQFMQLLQGMMSDIQVMIASGECPPMKRPETLEELHLLSDWCEGFLFAHQYLEDLWAQVIDDDDFEGLEESVHTLLYLAETFVDLSSEEPISLIESLAKHNMNDEQFTGAFEWFTELLGHYSKAAIVWREYLAEVDQTQDFLAMEPVAKSAPCICGSGLSFEKCCLH